MSDDVIYGRRAVLEALLAGEGVLELLVADTAKPEGTLRTILNAARQRDIPIKWVPAPALDREIGTRSGHERHQGVVARVAAYPYVDLAEIVAASLRKHTDLFVLALDSIQDVHNLGSLLRTAEAVGVDGVLLADREAASITPAVRNASAGAVAHLSVARLELPSALDELRERGTSVVGLDSDGDTDVFAAPLDGPLAIVVGGEGKGLRPAVRRRCDAFMRLPMRGQVASLNAAVAGSIAMYEALRRRTTAED